jgi:hypothetical protein
VLGRRTEVPGAGDERDVHRRCSPRRRSRTDGSCCARRRDHGDRNEVATSCPAEPVPRQRFGRHRPHRRRRRPVLHSWPQRSQWKVSTSGLCGMTRRASGDEQWGTDVREDDTRKGYPGAAIGSTTVNSNRIRAFLHAWCRGTAGRIVDSNGKQMAEPVACTLPSGDLNARRAELLPGVVARAGTRAKRCRQGTGSRLRLRAKR